MSKKTRKKSPKTPSRKQAEASAKKSRPAAGRTAAKASARKSVGKPATASHKAPPKKLKATPPQKSAPRAATGSTAAAKATAENLPVNKPPETNVGGRIASLSEGSKAPAFQLPRDGGSSVSLADYRGRKLVIFFYPRADTPGCTKEAIEFTRLSGAFADSGTAVLGVSADPLTAQEAFRDRHQLSMPLISDETHEMLKSYGVWGEKSMYGRTFLGILRTTVLIGADGKIARIWRNVKVDGHADEVLAAARAL